MYWNKISIYNDNTLHTKLLDIRDNGLNCFYNYLYATGSIGCSKATFGDSIYGVVKKCYYK